MRNAQENNRFECQNEDAEYTQDNSIAIKPFDLGNSNYSTEIVEHVPRDVTVFESAASEYFRSRTFQGLEPTTDSVAASCCEIQKGQFGIAADYKIKQSKENNCDC